MYVAVLMVALIVGVIGVSGLTLTRIQLRSAEGGGDTVSARFYAQSAVEMGLFSVADDVNWRTAYSNDAWTVEQAIGGGTFAWKLVDELDGDLANDDTQPARLYGRGTVGEAVRIYSVLAAPLEPEPNLLTNGGMEDGVTDWEDFGDCDLGSHMDDPHSGAAYMWVKDRDDSWAGPRQYVSTAFVNGGTYNAEVWVKLKDFPQDVSLELWAQTTLGWTSFATAQSAGTTWTRVRGQYTTTWSGTLLASIWKLRTVSGQQEFKVDDAVLSKVPDGPALIPVRGTWRREVLP